MRFYLNVFLLILQRVQHIQILLKNVHASQLNLFLICFHYHITVKINYQ